MSLMLYYCLDIHADAKFVLIVEKQASFQRLLENNVLQKLHPCIVITARAAKPKEEGKGVANREGDLLEFISFRETSFYYYTRARNLLCARLRIPRCMIRSNRNCLKGHGFDSLCHGDFFSVPRS